jgi:zinc transport system permease protein
MPLLDYTPSWADFLAGLELYRDAMLCGAAAGLVLGYLGVFVVLRRLVFVPLAVTHAAGFGVALAFFLQLHLGDWVDPTLGALFCSIAVSIALLSNPRRVTAESVIGLIYILAASGAVLLGSRISQEAHELGAIIFGTAVAVRPADLHATLLAGAIVLAIQLWTRRGLIFSSFDPDGARVQQLPVRLLDSTLLLSTGLMVAVATHALGAMPVFAFTVLPAIAALGLVRRIGGALALAALIGCLCAVIGYIVSFFLELPVGASQTVLAGLFAAVALPLGRRS